MKVLHLLDTLNRGGAETLCLDVCRNAAANRLDLIFAALGGGALESDFKDSGAEFIRFERRLPIDFGVVTRLRKLIKARRVAVVHTHQAVEAIHAHLACLGTKTKIVLTHHGFIADRKNFYALKFLIPRTAANIIVSQALRRWYETVGGLRFPERRTTILYNGVDEKRLVPRGANFKAELGLRGDALLFGMIANFYRDPRKDQMTICRALPRVFADNAAAHCVFVGAVESGAEEKFEACVRFCEENNIADRVHFVGGRGDVPDVLAALDLFVCSSLQEGLPIAVNEAMLAKVPLIVSAIEPLLEASGNGEYAAVFQTLNAPELAEKIIRLLENENERDDLARRAYDYARANFSIETHLRELLKLYESLF